MIVSIERNAPDSTTASILRAVSERGLTAQVLDDGRGGTVIGIGGSVPLENVNLPGVTNVQQIHKPYMLASLEMRPPSTVTVGNVRIGNGEPVIIAGPCSVESRQSQIEAAIAVKKAGATMLRGGAFKPRTSPYSFQGLGEEGLQALAAAREITGLPFVTEVMEPDLVDLVAGYADMLQIGSRNMANFPLLKRVGRSGKPVLLKRGFSATVEEFLMSAEYIMANGNAQVVLCERGIRTFDTTFRFNLDLNVVPGLKELTHLPVIVDPSHGTGRRSLVKRMAMAGIAAGADGLFVEAHPDPDAALSDGYQTIAPGELRQIVRSAQAVYETLDGFDAASEAAEVSLDIAYASRDSTVAISA
jgi:3-deoxy-7-phosphoheptulonate synthase